MYDEHFSINNLPYLDSEVDQALRQVRLSSFNLDMSDLTKQTLNDLARLSRSVRRKIRLALQNLLKNQTRGSIPSDAIVPIEEVKLYLPIHVSEFTDFSRSKDHNLKAGEAILNIRKLPPSFLHFPMGYGGRASSIVVSGTPIARPAGHYRNDEEVVYDACRALDYELEIACIVGEPLPYGTSVKANDAEKHIFGLVMLNDWSARDIQGFEMMPLGPLMGKNFGTTMSPWVITLDALEPFRTTVADRDIAVAPHLEAQNTAFNIQFQAKLFPPNVLPPADTNTTICTSHLSSSYWSLAHLIAHQASGGCGLNTGDVLATGTVSGPGKGAAGCLLETTRGGKEDFEIILQDGSRAKRKYLEDGDTVLITGQAVNHDGTLAGVGFGKCVGTIVTRSSKY